MTFIINIWLHCYTKDKLASSLRSLLWLLWDQWHFLGIRILPPSTLSCILIILLYKVAEQGFLTRLLARCFQYFQPLWLPGGFPPGAPRGGPAHSSAGQQRVLREGGSCWCLWAPHPDVFTQRWIQVNGTCCWGDPGTLSTETEGWGDALITHRPHLTPFRTPSSTRFWKYSRAHVKENQIQVVSSAGASESISLRE